MGQFQEEEIVPTKVPYLDHDPSQYGEGRKVFIESYGCQMNFADTEIVYSILLKSGYAKTENVDEADIIFLNTCAIRDHAEHKIWSRLGQLRAVKQKEKKNLIVGVLGCMAERLKEQLLEREKLVDLVAGPDAYRDLPRLLTTVEHGDKALNVILSQDETYADITPVRVNSNGVSAYVSIMRGCNNMCTYCIVPFTRGRERSRPVASIVEEIRQLSQQGFKEVILLGQNVNSYNDMSELQSMDDLKEVEYAKGFKTVYKKPKVGLTFTHLMDQVSQVDPEMRVRFTSPHPKDFPDDLLHLIKERPNLCASLHIPAQSGSTENLERMRRGYTREAYIELIHRIREILPDVTISSDFISGFCGETHHDHLDTISLMELVEYDQAFMFAYSMREKTPAHRRLKDDVPEEIKKQRLAEVIDTFMRILKQKNQKEIGKRYLVLVEGTSKRSPDEWLSRNDGNKKVVFNNSKVPDLKGEGSYEVGRGDYVLVEIEGTTGMTLTGRPIAKTTIQEYTQFCQE